jgi:hypothetical protein
MSEAAVTSLVKSFSYEFIDDGRDYGSMGINADNVAVIDHKLLISLLFGGPEALEFIDLAQLSDDLEEFISSTSFLWLEERKPENDSVSVSELSADLCCQVVVDNIFEIN